MGDTPSVAAVIPTIGRPGLRSLVETLDDSWIGEIIVVDDRPHPCTPLPLGGTRAVVLSTSGRGPAAARNRGWKAASSEWILFIDDDVEPAGAWLERLGRDLDSLPSNVAAVQGRIRVPLPTDRPPTDWERNVAALETAPWITADMAIRRSALVSVGGFDERFPNAYREDSDLALRLRSEGVGLQMGERVSRHPVGSAPWFVSVTRQRGNADDARMRALHGRDWRENAGAGKGMLARHIVTTLLLAATGASLVRRRGRVGAALGTVWGIMTAAFAWKRISPGPRTVPELVKMMATSVAIPPAAVFWRIEGWLTSRHIQEWQPTAAVLFDRDGTLIEDVPYNSDPDLVRLRSGAEEAVASLHGAGMAIGLVTNQSGVGRGLLSTSDVEAVNRKVASLVGRMDAIAYCPHSPEVGCPCRKPAPGLILRAARELGIPPHRCVVVGDILSDVAAAEAAGARGIMVPTSRTRLEEVESARYVVENLQGAVDLILDWNRR